MDKIEKISNFVEQKIKGNEEVKREGDDWMSGYLAALYEVRNEVYRISKEK